MASRPLDSFMRTSEALAQLESHARRLGRAQEVFLQVTPEMLASACHVANLKAGKLILRAKNGAVAAKLKQLEPTLRDELCFRGLEVTEIEIKVQVRNFTNERDLTHIKRPPVRHIGPSGRSALANLANSLPEYSPLACALHNLIARSN